MLQWLDPDSEELSDWVKEWTEEQDGVAKEKALSSGVAQQEFHAAADQLAQAMVENLEDRTADIQGLDPEYLVYVALLPEVVEATLADSGSPADQQMLAQIEKAFDGMADRLRENEQFNNSFYISSFDPDESDAILEKLANKVALQRSVRPLPEQILIVRTSANLITMSAPPFSVDLSLRFVVQHPVSNEDVMSRMVQERYCYHPYYERYLSSAENQHLKRHKELPPDS